MCILFINFVTIVIYFFSNQFNNNSNKKIVKLMGSTQPMLGWVGLNFFFNPLWWVGSKNFLNPTHTHP